MKNRKIMNLKKNKQVLILVNHDVAIYNFRLELVEHLLEEGYRVHISSPYGERIADLIKLGAEYHKISIQRHGMNPVADMAVLREYHRLIKEIRPVIILGYTIKPNIYGAFAAGAAHVPFVANITGLGSALEHDGIKQRFLLFLYKNAFTSVQRVFFQNSENMKFFRKAGIAAGKHILLPGSGVNLERFPKTPLPECGDGKSGRSVKFAFLARIMKEKGIDQYLAAAESIKACYPAAEFHVCGFCEDEYEGKLQYLERMGIINYHGMIRDVAGFMRQMHCIVHPTYYPEGLSNVLLEACACGRAVITTDRSGCREVVKDGVNGYQIPAKSEKRLVTAIEQFINLSQEAKAAMGRAGRKLVEKRFDRNIVVNAYMDEIHRALSV